MHTDGFPLAIRESRLARGATVPIANEKFRLVTGLTFSRLIDVLTRVR